MSDLICNFPKPDPRNFICQNLLDDKIFDRAMAEKKIGQIDATLHDFREESIVTVYCYYYHLRFRCLGICRWPSYMSSKRAPEQPLNSNVISKRYGLTQFLSLNICTAYASLSRRHLSALLSNDTLLLHATPELHESPIAAHLKGFPATVMFKTAERVVGDINRKRRARSVTLITMVDGNMEAIR